MEEPDEFMDPVDLVSVINLKYYAIRAGNATMLFGACALMNDEPTKRELSETLMYAVGKYGWSIHDPRTNVGMIYSKLFADYRLESMGTKHMLFGADPELACRIICENRGIRPMN